MNNTNFWKNKRVLVTGHTGFKGSWLSIYLRLLGAKVTGYALDPKNSKDNFVLSKIEKHINHIVNDIRDFESLFNAFNDTKPHVVFHLAAQPLVLKSYNQPKETFDTNIGGTVNVLEASRFCKSVRVIVNITSDKCYFDSMPEKGYNENNRLGGYDSYSSSKACSELVTDAYRNSFFNINNLEEHNVSLSSARAGNVIGGGDWNENRLIPDCIRSLENSEKIVIRNPEHFRPWQHVLEPLTGYLMLAENMYSNPRKFSGAWNFGPSSDAFVNVETLVKKLIKVWGSGDWEAESISKEKLREDKKLFLDATKAWNELNWKSNYNIDESIDLTLNWYKNYYKSDVLDLCEKQIKKYLLIEQLNESS